MSKDPSGGCCSPGAEGRRGAASDNVRLRLPMGPPVGKLPKTWKAPMKSSPCSTPPVAFWSPVPVPPGEKNLDREAILDVEYATSPRICFSIKASRRPRTGATRSRRPRWRYSRPRRRSVDDFLNHPGFPFLKLVAAESRQARSLISSCFACGTKDKEGSGIRIPWLDKVK
ncbi:hypothetical protein WN55_07280 [Dufourea novaeangliae]|uniref:Uncharacterized protein n=1 Tax=Dufourea novaeangliae TaxID=178035 RepID=A0A154PS27_DUFNO|nr:hypothetical protein WN55_07280 [Dufourea novaeangliae]